MKQCNTGWPHSPRHYRRTFLFSPSREPPIFDIIMIRTLFSSFRLHYIYLFRGFRSIDIHAGDMALFRDAMIYKFLFRMPPVPIRWYVDARHYKNVVNYRGRALSCTKFYRSPRALFILDIELRFLIYIGLSARAVTPLFSPPHRPPLPSTWWAIPKYRTFSVPLYGQGFIFRPHLIVLHISGSLMMMAMQMISLAQARHYGYRYRQLDTRPTALFDH